VKPWDQRTTNKSSPNGAALKSSGESRLFASPPIYDRDAENEKKHEVNERTPCQEVMKENKREAPLPFPTDKNWQLLNWHWQLGLEFYYFRRSRGLHPDSHSAVNSALKYYTLSFVHRPSSVERCVSLLHGNRV
jgi:hypothetical protein